MKAFAQLYAAIDETNRTNEKVAAMAAYFREADPEDAAWAIHFLIGRRPKRLVNSTRMQTVAAHLASIPMWLFGESYDAVGDLAETIALLLPDREEEAEERPLSYWVTERLLPLAALSEEAQMQALAQAWLELDRQERFVYNKLITGSFRVGVSQELVLRALSQVGGIPAPVIAHRMMGIGHRTAISTGGCWTPRPRNPTSASRIRSRSPTLWRQSWRPSGRLTNGTRNGSGTVFAPNSCDGKARALSGRAGRS